MRYSSKFVLVLISVQSWAQTMTPQQLFASRCGACHGEDAHGSAQGPGLAMNPRVAVRSTEQLSAYIQGGNAGAGMPSFASLPAAELATLVRFVKRINNDTIITPVVPV